MFHDDYHPPHFHAKYGEYQAKIEIETGEVIAGKLPRRSMSWSGMPIAQAELID